MYVVTSKLPDYLYERLDKLGKLTDRKNSYLIRKALEIFLEERDGYFIALHRFEQKNIRYSLEQVKNNDLKD